MLSKQSGVGLKGPAIISSPQVDGGVISVQMIGDLRPCASPIGLGHRGPMGRMQNRHELVADMAERGAVKQAQQLTESATRLIMQVGIVR